jgi:hypothetical protein
MFALCNNAILTLTALPGKITKVYRESRFRLLK